ncbi:MAG: arginine deiminase [Mycobacteriales bacterium]
MGAPAYDRSARHRVDSEVGRLRTVLLHRPGSELKRLTPRNNADLLFDGIPWVERAQQEHDAFARALRERDVEVLYLFDLLVAALDVPAAREQVLDGALRPNAIGPRLAGRLRSHLGELPSADLAEVLTGGLARDELPPGGGVVEMMTGPSQFIIRPLPNLLFTRDSSVWVEDRVAVTQPAMAARRRESTVTGAVYTHHPRFAGTPLLYGGSTSDEAWLEGGDVLLLGPGAVAVGVGQRTAPAGVEMFAAHAFAAGVARTVLAVPIAQERATMHLDTVCTMVDRDAVVMYPPVADTLSAYVVTPEGDGVRVDGPEPFLVAAAKAMGIDTLRVIDTGLDPVTAEREQWDDGNNTLAIAPGLVMAYERNTETNARLEDAGIDVVRIAGSELGSGRGGPRCMSCPVLRDPVR